MPQHVGTHTCFGDGTSISKVAGRSPLCAVSRALGYDRSALHGACCARGEILVAGRQRSRPCIRAGTGTVIGRPGAGVEEVLQVARVASLVSALRCDPRVTGRDFS
jgi:hypothetical protein